MADHSQIQWTDATWNTVSGCTRVSEGCDHCYIARTAPFRINGRRFDAPGIGGATGVALHEDRLTMPLHWRKPRRVFVDSMGDLFHDDVPTEHIAAVFAVMARTEQHSYQVLTKRPARMRALLADGGRGLTESTSDEEILFALTDGCWPLENVWIGVSAESQQWAEIRVPQLLAAEAAVRFVSAEPLLGPVDLRALHSGGVIDALGGDVSTAAGEVYAATPSVLDWVIAGGESGPDARPMSPDWARALRDQCTSAGTAFFFKQWGEWEPTKWRGIGHERLERHSLDGEPPRPVMQVGERLDEFGHRWLMRRVGKHAAGRELDGRTWDQYPAARSGALA